MPLIPSERQSADSGESDALALKHEPLKLIVADPVGPETDAASSVDDAMPRDVAVTGKGMEGVADEARMAG